MPFHREVVYDSAYYIEEENNNDPERLIVYGLRNGMYEHEQPEYKCKDPYHCEKNQQPEADSNESGD